MPESRTDAVTTDATNSNSDAATDATGTTDSGANAPGAALPANPASRWRSELPSVWRRVDGFRVHGAGKLRERGQDKHGRRHRPKHPRV